MSTATAPVSASQRFESLDVLRGLAVLGILAINIQTFAMYWTALQHPPAHMDMTGANLAAWFAAHVFFEMKFITIFSALFGAGIVLMTGDNGPERISLHYRRMIWLLVIGLIHGFVFWFGDILAPYALVGMVAVLFRAMNPARLFLWGAAGLAITGALMIGQLYASGLTPGAHEPSPYGLLPDEETLSTFVSAYQGGFLESRLYNAMGNLIALLSAISLFAGRLLGVMLIGMALFKTGFLTARWSAAAYAAAAVVSLGLGLPLVWFGAAHAVSSGFAISEAWIRGSANYFGSLPVAFGYASLAMLACKTSAMRLVRAPFAAAGRMAFTNYLMQTLIMVYIFTGPPGLGLYASVERIDQAKIVAAVWVFQLAFSVIWLRFFRFGPLEWLWRGLAYKRFQPIVKFTGPQSGASG